MNKATWLYHYRIARSTFGIQGSYFQKIVLATSLLDNDTYNMACDIVMWRKW